jgi:hypothetical protein
VPSQTSAADFNCYKRKQGEGSPFKGESVINDKYKSEIDSLKSILSEISKKENEIIEKIHEQEKFIDTQTQTKFLKANKDESIEEQKVRVLQNMVE